MFDEPVPSEINSEQFHLLVDRMEEELRKLGLYMEGTALHADPSGRPLLLMTTRVGDVAFSDRIQDPQKDKQNDEIRGMESDIRQQELRAMKDEIENEMKDLDDGD